MASFFRISVPSPKVRRGSSFGKKSLGHPGSLRSFTSGLPRQHFRFVFAFRASRPRIAV